MSRVYLPPTPSGAWGSGLREEWDLRTHDNPLGPYLPLPIPSQRCWVRTRSMAGPQCLCTSVKRRP